MKANKLLASILTAGLLLSGCGVTTPSEETGVQATETQPAAPVELCLAENGQSSYTIIKPDRCSDTVSSLTSLCWKTFAQTYGAELGISTDWVEDPAEIPADAPEILIGTTNRPESTEAATALESNLYSVICVGNRIVIVATNDAALGEAVNAFLGALQADENGRITVPTDLHLTMSLEDAWPLEGVPFYTGGTIAGSVLNEPNGFAGDNPSKVLCVSDTNADQFAAYIEKVQADGFTAVQRDNWDGITAYQCDKEGVSFYTYLSENAGEVRIILDNSKTASLEEFNYTYEAAEGETNEVFLFGMQAPIYDTDGNEISGVGQFMFVKLADNSLFVIDGGHHQQPNIEEFFRVAREITGTPEDEKIHISCWFITHCHSDHTNGMINILKNHADQVTLDRIMYNHKGGHDFSFGDLYPDVIYHMPRTGETIQLGNLTMDILYTHEDLLDAVKMEYSSDEYNDSSTVMKIHFDGASCLILGDLDVDGARILRNMYTPEILKVDVVQIAHHSLNPINDLYILNDAKIALVPAQEWYTTRVPSVWSTVQSTTEEAYCSDNTVGLRVVDGEVTVVYKEPAVFNN